MLVTFDVIQRSFEVSQLFMDIEPLLLKEDAPKKADAKLVTEDTFQSPTSALKFVAYSKTPVKLVTLPILHPAIFWLNAVADLNICPMSVTNEVSQTEIS